jgi:predicted small secreted protein
MSKRMIAYSCSGVFMKRTTILFLAATLALLSACETIAGLGRDTEKLGNNINSAASRNK